MHCYAYIFVLLYVCSSFLQSFASGWNPIPHNYEQIGQAWLDGQLNHDEQGAHERMQRLAESGRDKRYDSFPRAGSSQYGYGQHTGSTGYDYGHHSGSTQYDDGRHTNVSPPRYSSPPRYEPAPPRYEPPQPRYEQPPRHVGTQQPHSAPSPAPQAAPRASQANWVVVENPGNRKPQFGRQGW